MLGDTDTSFAYGGAQLATTMFLLTRTNQLSCLLHLFSRCKLFWPECFADSTLNSRTRSTIYPENSNALENVSWREVTNKLVPSKQRSTLSIASF